ncbi:MAG: Dabb family protein [Bacteroidota bacterium]|nr:Dabb family protein [Bacteroidota bacterium]
MIKHIVLFKLKEFESLHEKAEVLKEIKNGLEALIHKVEVLRFIEVGLNFELDSANYDICLTTHFDTVDDMNAYQVHPDHQEVSKYIKSVLVQRACVDYTF